MLRRPHHLLLRFLLAPVAGVALLVPVVGVAAAAPSTTSGASLADVAQQIAAAKSQLGALDTRTEVAAERFNAGRIALTGARRIADQRSARAAASAARVTRLRAQVSAFAASAYAHGGNADLSLGAQLDDPTQFLDRQGIAEVISRNQAGTLAGLRAAQNDALTTARAAAQAVSAARVIVDGLAADRRSVTVAQTQALGTVRGLQKQQAVLVRQAQVAEARAQAAAARAHAAADRAAALRTLIKAHEAAAAAQAQARALAAQAIARQQALTAQPSDSAPAPTSPQPQPAAPPSPPSAPTGSAGEASSAPSAPTPADPPPSTPTPATPTPPVATGGAVAVALSWARQELGKPYQWAAAGPDRFDCSGLTLFIYAKAGISLPHYSGAQFNVGRHVPRSQLQPGDLVFFGSPIHHMGIYIGGGQMIHSPQTGDVVRTASIDGSDYVGAVRIVG